MSTQTLATLSPDLTPDVLNGLWTSALHNLMTNYPIDINNPDAYNAHINFTKDWVKWGNEIKWLGELKTSNVTAFNELLEAKNFPVSAVHGLITHQPTMDRRTCFPHIATEMPTLSELAMKISECDPVEAAHVYHTFYLTIPKICAPADVAGAIVQNARTLILRHAEAAVTRYTCKLRADYNARVRALKEDAFPLPPMPEWIQENINIPNTFKVSSEHLYCPG